MAKDSREEMLEKVMNRKRTGGSILDAETYLNGSSNSYANNDLEELLKKSTENLQKLSQGYDQSQLNNIMESVKKDFGIDSANARADDLRSSIEQDFGIVDSNNYEKDYARLMDEMDSKAIYKKRFIAGLKRPDVLGNSHNTILLTGPKGTGKRDFIKKAVEAMSKDNMIANIKIPVIDCRQYDSSDKETIFLQDLYAALSKHSSIIVIQNIESLSLQLTNYIESLINENEITLDKRYVEKSTNQNTKTLQEASQVLSKDVKTKMELESKYIFILADTTYDKLYSRIGSPFFTNIEDVIEFEVIKKEEINDYLNKYIDEYKSKLTKMGFELSDTAVLADYVTEHYVEKDGINSIKNILEDVYKAIGECKLQEDISGSLSLKCDEEMIFVVNDQEYKMSDYVRKQKVDTGIEAELNNIVGLENVKDYILSLKDYFAIQQVRKEKGLKADEVSKHMIFMGNPGTGKTTIARILAKYLKSLGILKSGQLIEVTRADLVGQYVGHTAPKTMKVIQSAFGGVLFIDEAYSLYRGKEDSFGLEAIDTLVKAMEDYRDDFVVILAGYTKEMNEFLTANSGLKSRFNHILEFPDYTPEQLYKITEITVKSKQYKMEDTCKDFLIDYYTKESKSNTGNGRFARNVVEKTILVQSKRLMKENDGNYDILLLDDFKDACKEGE